MNIENLQTCTYCWHYTSGWSGYDPYPTCYHSENPDKGTYFSLKTIIQGCSGFVLRDVKKNINHVLCNVAIPVPIEVYKELPLDHKVRFISREQVMNPNELLELKEKDLCNPTFSTVTELLNEAKNESKKILEFTYGEEQIKKWMQETWNTFDKAGNLVRNEA